MSSTRGQGWVQGDISEHCGESSAEVPSGESTTNRQSDIRELMRPPPRRAQPRPPPQQPSTPTVVTSLPPDAAARRIVEALIAHGVDTFFGIPGGPAAPLFEAIRVTAEARLIESRHETAAAFEAATFYRASGKVPALVVTAGPGLTNATTGIVSAHLERVPLLVIAGDVAWAARGGKLAQDSGPDGIAMEQMLRPCTRAQIRVAKPQSAATQALAALHCALDPLRPGPSLLVVPIDRGSASAPETTLAIAPMRYPLEPPLQAVRTTAHWLAEAEHPLVVVGGGCRPYAGPLRALLDVLGVPFVTTPRAKGVVSEAHPHSLRNGGMAASLWARRYTATPVDVALVLASDLDDSSIGATPYLGQHGRLIHVDLDATVFRRNLETSLPVQADAGGFAEALYREVVRDGLRNPRGSELSRRARAASAFDVPDFATDERYPIAPHRAIADLEAAAGDDARFISDIGEHMLFCLHYLTARDPMAFHLQLNLGSMGSGIAGAIGLALAEPDRRVVCICGDGGMQMLGMEALVAVKERLPIVFAVFNDARYNMVHHGMKQIFGEADAWSTPTVDFCGWGRALGIPSAEINAPGEIDGPLLDTLTARGGPGLLDIRIDRNLRIRGGGRVEALQHMSMLDGSSQ